MNHRVVHHFAQISLQSCFVSERCLSTSHSCCVFVCVCDMQRPVFSDISHVLLQVSSCSDKNLKVSLTKIYLLCLTQCSVLFANSLQCMSAVYFKQIST